MKKMIKESERTILVVDIMFYAIYVVLGIILLKYPEIEVLKPIEYASPLFFILGFFSLVAYFVNRREDNYEFLILGLINVAVGAFILFYSYYTDTGFILGNAILIYSLSIVLNKGWHTIKLSRKNDVNMFPKFGITILLTLLGLLVITNLYRGLTMQTLILGYYFISFGLFSLLEPIMMVVMKNPKIYKYLNNVLNGKEENKVVLKEVKIERIKKVPEKIVKQNEIKHETVKEIKPKIDSKKRVIKQPATKKKKINK